MSRQRQHDGQRDKRSPALSGEAGETSGKIVKFHAPRQQRQRFFTTGKSLALRTIPRSEQRVIVKELKRLHEENLAAACATVERGIRAGELLYKAKAQVEHGAWLPWLREHAPFTVSTAENYMRCYDHRDELKSQRITNLARAYGFLRRLAGKTKTEPEKPKPERRMNAAEEQLVSKGIARDAADAKRLLKKQAEKQPSENEVLPDVAVEQPSGEPQAQPPKSWTPPLLKEADLTDEERAVLKPLKDYLANAQPERVKAIMRGICEGGLLT